MLTQMVMEIVVIGGLIVAHGTCGAVRDKAVQLVGWLVVQVCR